MISHLFPCIFPYYYFCVFFCCGGKNRREKQTEKITRREKGESQTEEKISGFFFET
jgi:hypothetical protein